MGVANRGSYDLECHAQGSGKNFEYLDKENLVDARQAADEIATERHRRYIPHCIEPSLGVDRLFLALLTSAYREEKVITVVMF